MIRKAVILILFFTLLLLSCGEFDETERVNINVRVNPEGAGNVLTSGGIEIGNTAEFFAVENDGWTFAGWSGDVDSFENPLTIVLEGDVEVVGNFSLFVNEYEISLTVADSESSVDLLFGQNPSATDGFDSGFDYEAPPTPPDGIHAWFEAGGLKLFDDFRNAFSREINWNLKLQNASTGISTLQWNSTITEFNGSLFLSAPDGDFTVDMIAENSFNYDSAEYDEFVITFKLDEE
jgi:hypothetical protein